MGAASAAPRFKYTRIAYIAAFFVLQLYRVPWETFLVRLL
jgi:hypothetical protein